MKKLVIAWALGFVCAMTLVVRWTRIGNAAVSTEDAPPEPSEVAASPSGAPAAEKPTGVRRFASTGMESVLVGARADLGGLRQLLDRVRPDRAPVPKPVVDGPAETIDVTTEGVSAAAG
jgi:hypothetical protein